MDLRLPAPRKTGLMHRAWLCPTNAVGHVVARLARAQGPYPVGSDRAPAQYYLLPDRFRWWFGAITIGHVILGQPRCLGGVGGRWTMAHELAHTRQHDVLGPLYLPLHGIFQLVSVLLTLVRPMPGRSRVHAYNPLERAFLCVPYDYLMDRGRDPLGDHPGDDVLTAFGVSDFECCRFEPSQS